MKKASLHYIESLETAPKPAITSSKTVVQVSPPVSSKPLESSGEPTKSKAELKAERRAKQVNSPFFLFSSAVSFIFRSVFYFTVGGYH